MFGRDFERLGVSAVSCREVGNPAGRTPHAAVPGWFMPASPTSRLCYLGIHPALRFLCSPSLQVILSTHMPLRSPCHVLQAFHPDPVQKIKLLWRRQFLGTG